MSLNVNLRTDDSGTFHDHSFKVRIVEGMPTLGCLIGADVQVHVFPTSATLQVRFFTKDQMPGDLKSSIDKRLRNVPGYPDVPCGSSFWVRTTTSVNSRTGMTREELAKSISGLSSGSVNHVRFPLVTELTCLVDAEREHCAYEKDLLERVQQMIGEFFPNVHIRGEFSEADVIAVF